MDRSPSRFDSAFGDSGLFRRVAVESQRPAQMGEIVLVPGSGSRWTAAAALTMVVVLLAYVALGSYTRRSTVTGQLTPSEGLIRIISSQPGQVIERLARDGQQVKQGEPLFVISGDRAGPDAANYQRGIAMQIEARIASLQAELQRLGSAEQQSVEHLTRREELLRAEQQQLQRQGSLLDVRVAGADDAHKRYLDLYRQGYVSRDELLAREVEQSEARARLEEHRRDRLTLEREAAIVRREQQELLARYATQRSELERSVLLARQEFTEVEARRRVVVSAPADGQLTLVQADIGQVADPQRPLAHLVPAGSQLVARLYLPSSAAGFTRVGDTVLLRYDAFPYQKFGQQAGTVFAVSTAAATPAELEGLSLRPNMLNEPIFAVSAQVPAQTMGQGANTMPLQAGMRLEADLLHETRQLYEWILEPLFAARERGQGSSGAGAAPVPAAALPAEAVADPK
jgi:membrane fusion protein